MKVHALQPAAGVLPLIEEWNASKMAPKDADEVSGEIKFRPNLFSDPLAAFGSSHCILTNSKLNVSTHAHCHTLSSGR